MDDMVTIRQLINWHRGQAPVARKLGVTPQRISQMLSSGDDWRVFVDKDRNVTGYFKLLKVG